MISNILPWVKNPGTSPESSGGLKYPINPMLSIRHFLNGLSLAVCLFFVAPSGNAQTIHNGHIQLVDKPTAKAGNYTLSTADLRIKPIEDWTTPYLNTSHLVPDTPTVAEKDDGGTFTREMVSLQWRPFDAIYVYIIKPKGVVKPSPVIYLYGYPSSTNRFLNDRYCRAITANGYAAIGFDTALTGERFRMRPMREWFVSELPESLATSTHDVSLVLNYLATRGDLDVSHSGIFGQGSGATIAILASAADSRIKAVDLLSPWGDWPDWTKKTTKIPEKDRLNYTQVKFLKSVATLDPINWLQKLKDRRVRLQFLETDTTVPPECQRAMIKSCPQNIEEVSYDSIPALYSETMSGRLFEWMAKQLNAQPSPSMASTVTPIKQ